MSSLLTSRAARSAEGSEPSPSPLRPPWQRGRGTVWAGVVGLAGLFLAGACGGDEPSGPRVIPFPTDRPYVSVAVDNHFHDVHVEDDVTIAFEQGFIIKNQGSNLHNVTIPQIDFDEDIRPGEQIEFLGDRLARGTYDIICRYHPTDEMIGRLTIE